MVIKMVRRKSNPRSNISTSDSSISKTHVLVDRLREKRRRHVRYLQEIRHLRNSVNLIIPKLPFIRLVRQIIIEFGLHKYITRIKAIAIEALQEAMEAYIVQFFEDCYLLSMHAKRVTLQVRDLHLARRLRGRSDVINA